MAFGEVTSALALVTLWPNPSAGTRGHGIDSCVGSWQESVYPLWSLLSEEKDQTSREELIMLQVWQRILLSLFWY